MNPKDLAHIIRLAADQIDMPPRDLLDAAINEEIEYEIGDGAIGDLADAFDDGEKIGLISLINKLIIDLAEIDLRDLRADLPA